MFLTLPDSIYHDGVPNQSPCQIRDIMVVFLTRISWWCFNPKIRRRIHLYHINAEESLLTSKDISIIAQPLTPSKSNVDHRLGSN